MREIIAPVVRYWVNEMLLENGGLCGTVYICSKCISAVSIFEKHSMIDVYSAGIPPRGCGKAAVGGVTCSTDYYTIVMQSVEIDERQVQDGHEGGTLERAEMSRMSSRLLSKAAECWP